MLCFRSILPKRITWTCVVSAPKGYNVATIQDEETSVQDKKKRRKRLNYQSKLECWETCEV